MTVMGVASGPKPSRSHKKRCFRNGLRALAQNICSLDRHAALASQYSERDLDPFDTEL
jgi:hypothetical protein